jgi:DNA-binding HxlR family transcriptional regulator
MSSPNTESDAISLADLSATHRDLLWVLSQTGPSESGPLHHALNDYYTDSIEQARVCDLLEELIEHEYVTKQTHNTNKYRLTESARHALSARQAWQAGTDTATGGGNE